MNGTLGVPTPDDERTRGRRGRLRGQRLRHAGGAEACGAHVEAGTGPGTDPAAVGPSAARPLWRDQYDPGTERTVPRAVGTEGLTQALWPGGGGVRARRRGLGWRLVGDPMAIVGAAPSPLSRCSSSTTTSTERRGRPDHEGPTARGSQNPPGRLPDEVGAGRRRRRRAIVGEGSRLLPTAPTSLEEQCPGTRCGPAAQEPDGVTPAPAALLSARTASRSPSARSRSTTSEWSSCTSAARRARPRCAAPRRAAKLLPRNEYGAIVVFVGLFWRPVDEHLAGAQRLGHLRRHELRPGPLQLLGDPAGVAVDVSASCLPETGA